MTRRAAFRQADVARLVRGAIAGGLAQGTFALQLIEGRPTLLPLDPKARAAMLTAPQDEDADLDAKILALMGADGKG